jgi:mono/diheme cytochrome c family protein
MVPAFNARVPIIVIALLAAAGSALPAEGEGMDLYNKKCAMCHGKDGVAKAMAKGSANLNDPEWQKSTSVDAIAKLTTEGKGKMPGYDGKLEPDQIKLVATYVLTLEPAEPSD